MNVAELIAELEDMDQDAEVRLAIQPDWPFQHTIDSVQQVDNPDADTEPAPDPQDYEDEGEYDEDYAEWEAMRADQPAGDPVVYIAEGGQLYSAPYLPGAAANAIGWGR